MKNTNTYIQPSKIHGVGLFAKYEIKKGHKIIHGTVLKDKTNAKLWRKFKEHFPNGTFALRVNMCCINHRFFPNVIREGASVKGQRGIIAVRDIKAGEEIVENYFLLPDWNNPFSKNHARAAVDRAIKEMKLKNEKLLRNRHRASRRNLPTQFRKDKLSGNANHKKEGNKLQVAVFNSCIYEGKGCNCGLRETTRNTRNLKKTAWSMAEQVGHIKAFCIALKLPYVAVPPKTWQGEMLQGVKIIKKQKNGETVTDTKAMATIAFQNLFPNIKVPTGPRGKILDGVIDASLIALYLKRKNK